MTTVYEVPVERIDGTPAALREFAGRVLLVVNVASKCGLTPQYAGLQALYASHRDRGLVLLGFPANNFGAQEPGANEEIAAFCSSTYNVDFPLFAKISVKGADIHPLYRELIAAQPTALAAPDSDFVAKLATYGITPENPTDVFWNFEKFLIGRDGSVVARFAPDMAPDHPILLAAIERELAKPVPSAA
jgi:glutathione peroxidase